MRVFCLPAMIGLAALTTPVFAQNLSNWTPTSYAEFEVTILASADREKHSIYALTIGPKKFHDEVKEGYVEYLKFTRTPFNLDGAPGNVKEAFVRQEFFRDQTTNIGSAMDGTKAETTYRSVQKAFVVNCTTRAIANNGFTRFENNVTEGRAQYFAEGTTEYSKLDLAVPGKQSVGAGLVQAVCDGQYIYTPKT